MHISKILNKYKSNAIKTQSSESHETALMKVVLNNSIIFIISKSELKWELNLKMLLYFVNCFLNSITNSFLTWEIKIITKLNLMERVEILKKYKIQHRVVFQTD